MDNRNGNGLDADIEQLEIDPRRDPVKKGNCHYSGTARINGKTIEFALSNASPITFINNNGDGREMYFPYLWEEYCYRRSFPINEGDIKLLANYGPFNGKYKSAILNSFKKVYERLRQESETQ